MSIILGQTNDEWVEQRVAASAAASALRAELQTCREVLRDQLQERFGALPADLLRRIEACEDSVRLKAALRQVLHIQLPDELQL